MQVIKVKMARLYSCFFPGEVASFPDGVALKLIAERKAKRVLEDESLEEWPEAEDAEIAAELIAEGEGDLTLQKSEFKFDAATDLFMADGLDEATSMALHTNGLHTPEAVMEYLVAGKHLVDLADIGRTRAKKIAELYGE
jgi:hypothetical protein